MTPSPQRQERSVEAGSDRPRRQRARLRPRAVPKPETNHTCGDAVPLGLKQDSRGHRVRNLPACLSTACSQKLTPPRSSPCRGGSAAGSRCRASSRRSRSMSRRRSRWAFRRPRGCSCRGCRRFLGITGGWAGGLVLHQRVRVDDAVTAAEAGVVVDVSEALAARREPILLALPFIACVAAAAVCPFEILADGGT